MKRSLKLLIVAAGFATLPASALAQQPASQSFRVTVRVPEYCEINASPILAQAGTGFAAGTVFESCNMQDGFQVVASHRQLDSGEQVAFNYAGELSYLRADGWSQVANRTGAKHGQRPIAVQYTNLAAPLSIGLTITAF